MWKPSLDLVKSMADFKLTFHFFRLLFISIIVFLGIDYFLNYDRDWRLSAFIFGITFILVHLFWRFAFHLYLRNLTNKSVKRLSLDDCEYVVLCKEKERYLEMDLHSFPNFQAKWANVLYVPTGKVVSLNESYKICVHEYAYKLAKRRLKKKKGEKNEKQI